MLKYTDEGLDLLAQWADATYWVDGLNARMFHAWQKVISPTEAEKRYLVWALKLGIDRRKIKGNERLPANARGIRLRKLILEHVRHHHKYTKTKLSEKYIVRLVNVLQQRQQHTSVPRPSPVQKRPRASPVATSSSSPSSGTPKKRRVDASPAGPSICISLARKGCVHAHTLRVALSRPLRPLDCTMLVRMGQDVGPLSVWEDEKDPKVVVLGRGFASLRLDLEHDMDPEEWDFLVRNGESIDFGVAMHYRSGRVAIHVSDAGE